MHQAFKMWIMILFESLILHFLETLRCFTPYFFSLNKNLFVLLSNYKYLFTLTLDINNLNIRIHIDIFA